MNNSHHFEPNTFSKFTYCDYCSKFIWGVSQQGLECTVCHYRCHYDCEPKVNKICLVDGDGGDNGNTEPPKKTTAERAMHHIQKHLLKKEGPNMPPSSSSPEPQRQHNNSNCDASKAGTASMSFLENVENMVVRATLEASEKAESNAPVSEYLASIPPLHPNTMTRNFSRFISRCGAIFSLRDSIILLVSWDNPLNTWIAIVAYTWVCLHPGALLILPFLVPLYLILCQKTRPNTKGQRTTSYPGVLGDPPASVESTSNSAINPKKTISSNTSLTIRAEKRSDPPKQPKPTDGSFGSTLNIGLSLLSASGNESPEYRRNMQNIQQMMAEFSDGYDMVMDIWRQWSDNEDAQSLLIRVLLGASISTSALAYFVPFNYLCLASGIAVFFANTRFAKSLIVLVMRDPDISTLRKKTTSMLYKEIAAFGERGRGEVIHNEAMQRTVSIFENQRYHEDKGYTAEV
ncbi:integral peroxisomal membrane peroxin-domain-containing protein [Dichotomocladium elegans]|nr:integral peroxisomal membrane peroxin-domain-containing protein [Dichotomocladium elegans]